MEVQLVRITQQLQFNKTMSYDKEERGGKKKKKQVYGKGYNLSSCQWFDRGRTPAKVVVTFTSLWMYEAM